MFQPGLEREHAQTEGILVGPCCVLRCGNWAVLERQVGVAPGGSESPLRGSQSPVYILKMCNTTAFNYLRDVWLLSVFSTSKRATG